MSMSPYGKTNVTNSGYLDVLNIRPIPAEDSDIVFEITANYHQRPDLLSYDLYGTKELWWIFAQRNMDIIRDPVYDFTAGTSIYLPKKSNLQPLLGV
jgi:hypothetical protein